MPVSCEPICVAKRIRCASPPESVRAERLQDKYSKPTCSKKSKRNLISFRISLAIKSCLSVRFSSADFIHSASSPKSIVDNSPMCFSLILKCRLSLRKRYPSQSGQTSLVINSSAQIRIFSEVVSLNHFSIMFITPFSARLYTKSWATFGTLTPFLSPPP